MIRTLPILFLIFLAASCDREPRAPVNTGQTAVNDVQVPATVNPGKIDRDRLLAVGSEPGNWLTTGRDFGKTHYSPLDLINRDNVGRLGFAWEYLTGTRRGLEATPVIVDGRLYTSGPFGKVFALDAATGEELWKFDPVVDGQAMRKSCCDAMNRGVAVWQGMVYVAALDGRLFALDAGNGAVRWVADTFIDRQRGYAITGAPEIAGNVVVIGNGGSEMDARGYVSAYDVQTGEFAWRFFIVPGDPALGFEHPELAMAAKTWDPDSRWDMGLGGTAWDALVYDPELNLLYVGTGNAALYNQAERSPSGGDNLFLTSILAINPDTGRLAWHYQEVLGDSWDYTATQPILLADLELQGKQRKVLLHAPKNGFFYVLDRETGEFISAKNFVPQNWARSIDPVTGRPDMNLDVISYANGPALVFPFVGGARAWHPLAYSPVTGLAYFAAAHVGNIIYDPTPGHVRRPGLFNEGVQILVLDKGFNAGMLPPDLQGKLDLDKLMRGQPDIAQYAFIAAWDPVRQQQVWQVPIAGLFDRSGMLVTGGGLVIAGSATGVIRAYDDSTGARLFEMDVQSSIVAAPATYTVDGEQYVVVMAGLGGGLYTQAPDPRSAVYRYGNGGRILAFKLGGGQPPVRRELPPEPPFPQPPAPDAFPGQAARGGMLYAENCLHCHFNAPRGYPPDLRRLSPERHAQFNDIVLHGLLRPLGMPQWDDILSEEDTAAIHAYLISIAWDAYNAEQQQ